ncbi:N-acetylglutaminylglutamine amidotransferase [Sulfidibacter corallicola]|uniref:asparagine synthase (glutamine-hydrolyzing) n=1 Tax=Sulfidibacter corallicola TaxID=2818388 RepID=A0A8A4TKP2_SULCO|nr:N-acetylglutaminylglutamine amidotransferase [Sulfidibacter corallicola]QTD49702.1 N-acetylglutaminylglutamine amidotransferase [Sulfidibacter corallicola]
MCGLCGIVRFDSTSIDRARLEDMTGSMASRGPDARGMFVEGSVGLGHRRLKIIDLSDHSAQPMVDRTLNMAIVFNGCIYNYRELRDRLAAKGYAFFSRGDTEVVLKAFHAWGPDCVDHLQGMFAFAVVDLNRSSLWLVRDRLGIKPLYFSRDDHEIRFASSLPALLAGGGVDTEIDPIALHHYLSFHGVVPAPHTMFRGIRKVPPATIAQIDAEGRMRQFRYWSPSYEPTDEDRRRDVAEWRDLVLSSLKTAVRRRMVADVPVGVLLSGGVDSSLIVGLLAEQGQHDLQTFSIGFENVGDEEGNEFRYSDLIARTYETQHHRLFVDSSGILDHLDDCIAAMSEPMTSHDNIGFYLLSREVSKHVKVVQSGQGADEVFGGYHWYPPLRDSVDPVGDYARVFFDRDQAEMAEVLHPRFLADQPSLDFVERHFAMPDCSDPVAKALRLDTHIMLVDDPVKRVDNMTMAWGLEARVPFLDHELVELAARVPSEHHVLGSGKHVLKEAARRVIPAEVIDRPKGYFPVPALKYLRGSVLERVRDVVTSDAARQRGLIHRPYLDKLLADPEHHITPLRGSKLWQLALLEYWFQIQLGQGPGARTFASRSEGAQLEARST